MSKIDHLEKASLKLVKPAFEWWKAIYALFPNILCEKSHKMLGVKKKLSWEKAEKNVKGLQSTIL